MFSPALPSTLTTTLIPAFSKIPYWFARIERLSRLFNYARTNYLSASAPVTARVI
jgi:hypothetical protein